MIEIPETISRETQIPRGHHTPLMIQLKFEHFMYCAFSCWVIFNYSSGDTILCQDSKAQEKCPQQRVHCCWVSCTTDCTCRADSRLAPSQWETALQSNAVSHWLGANLELALTCHPVLANKLSPPQDHHGSSNYWQLHSLFNSLCELRKHLSCTSLVLCEGNPPVTGRFPSQSASNVECLSL